MTKYEQGFIDGVKKEAEQASRGKRQWLYSSIENPTFRICPYCGTPFRTDINIKLNYCPDCGNSPMETER